MNSFKRLFLSLSSLLLSLVVTCSGKDVIVLGGTGLVGSLVVKDLTRSPKFDKIHMIVRKPGKAMQHDKVNEIVVSDLSNMLNDEKLIELANTKKQAW